MAGATDADGSSVGGASSVSFFFWYWFFTVFVSSDKLCKKLELLDELLVFVNS